MLFLLLLLLLVERVEEIEDGVSIVEALAATGLRSVRYIKEVYALNKIIANDLDPKATELININFQFNGIDVQDVEKYAVTTEDACALLNRLQHAKQFYDVVDIDPYGTAIPFLDSSIQALANNGKE